MKKLLLSYLFALGILHAAPANAKTLWTATLTARNKSNDQHQQFVLIVDESQTNDVHRYGSVKVESLNNVNFKENAYFTHFNDTVHIAPNMYGSSHSVFFSNGNLGGFVGSHLHFNFSQLVLNAHAKHTGSNILYDGPFTFTQPIT